MKLYIDTNIYLSYVSPTSDIKSLEKLKKLIKEDKVELVLPSQTKKEFLKHFKDRITKAKAKLTKSGTHFDIPNELKSERRKNYTDDEKDIIKKIDDLNNGIKKYRASKILEFTKHIELVEKLLNEIFDLATFFEYTDEIVTRAVVRYVKGLPPKKEDFKFGDAIIWETLKENIRREELVIVSFDNDFNEPKKKKGGTTVISKVLAGEWKKHTTKKATLFPLLAHFVNSIDKNNPISSATIKKEETQAGTILSSHYIFTGTPSPQTITASGGALRAGTYAAGLDSDRYMQAGSLASIITGGSNDLTSPSSMFNAGVAIGGSGMFDAGGTGRVVSIGSTAFAALICQRCGKSYSPSLTSITFQNLCPECSKNNGTIFAF